jgi:hypothetical protein
LRRDAKASSGGSTAAGGFDLGRVGRAFAAVLLTLLLVPAAASAALPEHAFLETFGSAAQPTFSSELTAGMAVDQSTGEVLVIDAEAEKLSRYHADGTASGFSGQGGSNSISISFEFSPAEVQVAVDNSGTSTDGNIYVARGAGGIKMFDTNGNSLGELTESSEGPLSECFGVAVDPLGNVYANCSEEIHKYHPSGAAPVNADNVLNFTFSGARGLAAGAGPTAGFLFVAKFFGSTVKLDDTTGSTVYEVDPGAEDTTISTDPFNGHVLIASGSRVKEFRAGASGATEASNTIVPSFVKGIAVSRPGGDVYVTRNESPNIDVFAPLLPVSAKLAIDTSGGNSSGQIDCEVNGSERTDEPCAEEYVEGTRLKLIPDPDANSEFSGFEGGTGSASACTGTSPCSFAIGEDSSVDAPFDFEASLIAITGLTPDKGLSEGGNSVEVEGQNFTGAESVKFGSNPASFSVESPTLIKATAPPGSIGTVEVHVKTPGGESIATEADKYTYVPSPPAVSAISPTKGPTAGGITVTISGANLEGAEEVKFGASAATITEDTATQIKATAPACSEGTVHVTVKTAGGTSPTSAADEYTCVPAPTVSSVSPTKGPLGGGETVMITGTNLSGAEAVKFGPNAATITEDTATQIKVTAPTCVAGALHVTVTTPGGTSATGAADEFTCVAAPTISSITPAKGPDEGGNQIEIQGLNLSAASKVEFGTTIVSSPFLANSATKIKVKVPTHAAGKVDVRVTTVGGTSAVVPADEYTFVAPPVLTIQKAGSGSGSVSCDGGACKPSYVFGTKVALSATASAGSAFAGFSGGGCSGTACTLTLEEDMTVTATFNANPPAGGGGGSTPPPAPTPTPTPKPLKCKKGFKKKTVHGKARCVKVKKHKKTKHGKRGA